MAQETLPDRSSPGGPGQDSGGSTGPAPATWPDGRAERLRHWLRVGGRAGWPRTLRAVTAGLVMWPAFPPYDLTFLAPVGVALFIFVLRGLPARTGAWLGFVAGTAFFLPVLEGIAAIGPDGWIVLSLVQALYFVPLGAGISLVTRLPLWPLWTAALWVGEELVRGHVPFGGFPWARLAFSQTATVLTPYASYGGAPLVTFLTALVGGLLAYAAVAAHRAHTAHRTHTAHRDRLRADDQAGGGASPQTDRETGGETGGETRADRVRRFPTPGRRSGLLAALLPVGAALGAVAALAGGGALIPTPTAGRPVTVAVVQGNVPRLGLDSLGQRKAVLNNHVRVTHELAAKVRAGTLPRPELVVWPENASDLDPYSEPEAYMAIDGAVKAVGVPVLVGALTDTPDGEKVENRGIVWDPRTGPGDYYVKRHPVPFGEYLPFRDVLTKLITRFERIPRDFAKGTRSGVMRLGPVTVGDVICFEVAYDREVRDVARGSLLVVQTNNATYGRTSLPPQQVAMSRLRAVEHGRTILVAATSGISAIVAPDGRMIDRSGEFVPDLQVATVQARTSRTLADRVGAAPERVLAVLGLGAVCAAAWTAVRKDEGN
ncbi:apolipoprotein N-acyltransferase [Actinomadura pelletieri DSM 43383]|uniref:Apolipoprotein N-acyltransferase n=1 Tax=Actinomadura pelletieri DSM 43383 TaxID=1120940 RepID=A0A495QLJ6_9ACTN|nr:apolipoprotein N-acyltransferase [Actinomadura pelletieri]RKS73457.1 apolipoprotein N-acyltransferase [Actinomadura pelletieri DSM 43383]